MSNSDEITKDIGLLDAVLMRLAVVGDDRLQSEVHSLLVPVLAKLSTPHEPVRKKVIEVLSHFNKRVKPNASISLPLAALVQLYLDPAQPPLLSNFVIIYVELAFNRAPLADKLDAWPRLLQHLPQRSAAQQLVLLTLATSVLEKTAAPLEDTDLPKLFPFAQSTDTMRLLLDFFLDVLLCPATTPAAIPMAPTTM
jgi:proteasome component ECM29